MSNICLSSSDGRGKRTISGLLPGALVCLAVLVLALAAGCGGVSEDELNKIKEENMSLALELESERRKTEILNQALASAYGERDRLVAALEAPIALPEEVPDATPPTPPRYYTVKSGDTLGRIASANKTSTGVLVTLNPYLRERRDLMVWENDKILLPPQ